MKTDAHHRLVFCCGAPESGKSYRIKSELAATRPARLVVIDPDGEYPDAGYLHDSLGDFYRSLVHPHFSTRFRPAIDRNTAEKQFDQICRMVRWLVDPQPGQTPPASRAPVTFVCDELADFIGSSFRESPASFQWIIRRGRKHGVSVLLASQRPAEISKTVFDLASVIRAGRLNTDTSIKSVAGSVGVSIEDMRGLIGHEYFERDKRDGKLTGKSLLVKKQPDRPAGRPSVARQGARRRK